MKPVVGSMSEVSFVTGFVHLMPVDSFTISEDWRSRCICRGTGSVVAKGARNKLPSGPNKGATISELHALRMGAFISEELGAGFSWSMSCP